MPAGLLRDRENDVALAAVQRPRRAGRKLAEGHWTKTGTHKSLHHEVESLTEPPDFPVLALGNGYLELPQSTTEVVSRDFARLNDTVIKLDRKSVV